MNTVLSFRTPPAETLPPDAVTKAETAAKIGMVTEPKTRLCQGLRVAEASLLPKSVGVGTVPWLAAAVGVGRAAASVAAAAAVAAATAAAVAGFERQVEFAGAAAAVKDCDLGVELGTTLVGCSSSCVFTTSPRNAALAWLRI